MLSLGFSFASTIRVDRLLACNLLSEKTLECMISRGNVIFKTNANSSF